MPAIATTDRGLSGFLSGASKQILIGGKWTAAASGREFETFNPSTGGVLTSVAQGDAEDVERAVRSARTAFEGEWSKWKPYDRQRLLMKVHDLVEKNFDELALIETMDMGAPLSRTQGMKKFMSQAIMFYATQTSHSSGETLRNSLPGDYTTLTFKAPVGVVGGILAWNAPLISQWWILGPVLATGCTVVLKPAEEASLSVLRMAELLQEAGVPDGVVNVVTGFGDTAGAALVAHPDVDRVSFTGSTDVGRKIVTASAGNLKRLQLELGGKSPDIVFADADLDLAVPGAAMAVFSNSGQICYAGTRLFVERGIHEEFIERLSTFSRTLRVGPGTDPNAQLGPLVSGAQLDRVMHYVELGTKEGASLAVGGKRLGGDLAGGYFVEPTIFTGVQNHMSIARDEIFGPVISVIPFDGAEQAVMLANDTEYGLGGAVWTRNINTALKMAHSIKAGSVWVNCYGQLDPGVGFGGYKMSGYGWKGGPGHVESFLYQKGVCINLN